MKERKKEKKKSRETGRKAYAMLKRQEKGEKRGRRGSGEERTRRGEEWKGWKAENKGEKL